MWNLLALVLDLLGLGVPVRLAPPATWPSLSSDLDCSDKPSLATFGHLWLPHFGEVNIFLNMGR